MADTLHAPRMACEPLTRWSERTEAPFFFTQFLDALHREGLLRRMRKHRACARTSIRSGRRIPDNVVDLMVEAAPAAAPTQERLQRRLAWATVRPAHLALVSGGMTKESSSTSGGAPENSDRAHLFRNQGRPRKVLHDRIQKRTYSLIPRNSAAHSICASAACWLVQHTADRARENL